MQRRTLIKVGVAGAAVLAVAGGSLSLLGPGIVKGRFSAGARAMFEAVAVAVLQSLLPALSILKWQRIHISWPWHAAVAAIADGQVAVQMGAGTAKNFDAKQWHNVKLQFSGTTITGFVDGAQVLTTTNDTFSRGMAGLVTGDTRTRNTACFDNLLINAVGGLMPKPTEFTKQQSPIYKP